MSEADTIDNPRAAIGGNRPLIDIFREHNDALPQFLADEHGDLLIKADELKADFELAPTAVDTDDLEREMTDLGGRLAKFLKQAEAQRTIDKAPTLHASRIVDNFFTGLKDKIGPCMTQVERRVNAYKDAKAKAERERIAEEQRRAREAEVEAARAREEAAKAERERAEAARRAAEESDEDAAEEARQASIRAQDAAMAAKQAENDRQRALSASKATGAPVPVRGDSGTSSVQSLRWTGEIVELEAIDLNELRPYLTRTAIETAVRQYAVKNQDTKPLAGVRIFQQSSTSFRS